MIQPERLEREVEARLRQRLGQVPGTTTILVMAPGRLLMGKRRDNGKWTLPGGGMNEGELPLIGAIRELKEEAGLEAPSLDYLGAEVIAGRSGREVCVYVYRYNTQRCATKTSNDPDEECAAWEWVDITGGLPEDILTNLHSPRNIALLKAGLL